MPARLIKAPEDGEGCTFLVMATDHGADGAEIERFIVGYATREQAAKHAANADLWKDRERNPFDPSRPINATTLYMVIPVPTRDELPTVSDPMGLPGETVIEPQTRQ